MPRDGGWCYVGLGRYYFRSGRSCAPESHAGMQVRLQNPVPALSGGDIENAVLHAVEREPAILAML